MKISLDVAIKAIESGYTLVKDDKAKTVHHVNKETGESMITYKAAYFLQSVADPRVQRQVTAAIAKKLCALQGIVNNVAPFLVNGLIAKMKNKHHAAWSAYCFDNDEKAAEMMLDMLLDSVETSLPENIAEEITYRYNMAITYQEVAQFNMMDDDEQQDQEMFWEYADRQSAFDEKLAMYYNEY